MKELLYLKEPNELVPPLYIAEGLEWLQEKIKNKNSDYRSTGFDMLGGVE